MRWRSSSASAESPTSGGHDNEIQAMSSSMDDDEPDSSSQANPVEGEAGTKERLGSAGSDLPPSAEGLLEKENLTGGEEKLSDGNKGSSSPPPPDTESTTKSHNEPKAKSQSIDAQIGASSKNKTDPDIDIGDDDDDEEEEEDDEGRDHSQPPDDSSETDTRTVPWKPQTTQSTCEFTHTIVNYSQKRESGCKKAEYSATTVDDFGNRWRLIVYVNGNGRASNHHLSLFLQVADADDLPFGWKKAVSYVLTLEHPSGGNLSYAKRNPDKTFKLCPKAIDWGWSQFITSDRIQQEGFVSNDSLTVRASVTVKSSSVSIDSEDAELYLKCAVEEGGAEAVKLCLSQGASVNCKFKDDLYTPLHTACSSGTSDGSMEVLNLLLEKGADGNACNKWRETPLLIAANNGHRAAVEALLKHGADPSLCSEAGWSALTFAAHKGYDDIVALLLKAGAPVNCRVTEDSSTPLHKACAGSKSGHLSAVKQLLDGGADVHALNKWRETPLLTAANHGQAGAVEALLKAGADPCKCTDTGWSPLSIAAYKGHDSVVKLLLEEGAPTEEADPTLSALLQAATKGLPDTVELLLRHGADHTVTTKKGDTALSILVEQNLIDAAVEMVTEYKASVPRCSRDRKKVQRARLLINLRMKQHQREGKHLTVGTDDDETDEEDSDDMKSAQHDEGGSSSVAPSRGKKKKKKGKSPKLSAEEQARAAEEALLLELEQEDAKAKKEEAEANSKRAKKKKKKERERQQKMKEEQERREKEEKEAKERERIRKEREEKERKERQQKLKEQRERELKEAAEREKLAAVKRKEKEEKEKKHREAEQKKKADREKKAASASTTATKQPKTSAKVAPNQKQTLTINPAVTENSGPSTLAQVRNLPSGNPVSTTPAVNTAAKKVIQGKNRGWETTKLNPVVKQPAIIKPPQAKAPGVGLTSNATNKALAGSSKSANGIPIGNPIGLSKAPGANVTNKAPGGNPITGKAVARAPATEVAKPILPPVTDDSSSGGPTTLLSPRPAEYSSNKQGPTQLPPSFDKPSHNISTAGTYAKAAVGQDRATSSHAAYPSSDSGLTMKFGVGSVEHPAVAVYRREKVSEIIQRCRLAFSVVDEQALRRVLYRWIVRASHSQSAYLDCIVPSWADSDQQVTFFQRQFIAESRKRGASSGSEMVSMETLREAGSSMANLCHGHAKEIVQFRVRMNEQLPHDWTDATLLMSASDVRNGNDIGIVVDWANRSNLYFSTKEFTSLRNRYVGQANRFLTSLFMVKTRYETKAMLLGDSTGLDLCLPHATKVCLTKEASVSAELWSDPFSALDSNVFWGNFDDVDAMFGGLAPFSKDDGGSEELLSRHGGSVSVLLPFDNMVASRYVHRMLDLLEKGEPNGVPISFVVFAHADSFHDPNLDPSVNDLHLLDPRLGDKNNPYLRHVELLASGRHVFHSGVSSKVSTKGTILAIIQNETARARMIVNESLLGKIRASMSPTIPAPSGLPMVTPINFNGDYHQQHKESPATPQSGYFENLTPISPTPAQPAFIDFGGSVPGNNISKAFSPAAEPLRAPPPPRRGRLFELVDDGEEEHLSDVDVVSGMLNNFSVDLFQNNVSQEVDIEAISLMGIGAPPSARPLPPGSSQTRSRFGA